jgi:hypothetical protein
MICFTFNDYKELGRIADARVAERRMLDGRRQWKTPSRTEPDLKAGFRTYKAGLAQDRKLMRSKTLQTDLVKMLQLCSNCRSFHLAPVDYSFLTKDLQPMKPKCFTAPLKCEEQNTFGFDTETATDWIASDWTAQIGKLVFSCLERVKSTHEPEKLTIGLATMLAKCDGLI